MHFHVEALGTTMQIRLSSNSSNNLFSIQRNFPSDVGLGRTQFSGNIGACDKPFWFQPSCLAVVEKYVEESAFVYDARRNNSRALAPTIRHAKRACYFLANS